MSDILTIDALVDIYDATIDIKHAWYNMGLALKVKAPVMDSFSTKYHDDPDKCYVEVLKEWLNNVPNPKWEKLVIALRSGLVRHSNIANRIAEDHCPHMVVSESVAAAIPQGPPPRATSLPSMTLDKIKPQTSKSQTQLSRSLHQVADWLANQSLDTDALSFTAEGSHGQCRTVEDVNTETETTTDTYKTAASSTGTGLTRHGDKPIKLDWEDGGKSTQKMYSPLDTVICNDIVYFRPCRSEDILTYCSITGKWTKLTSCIFEDTTLTIVRGTLVTVGGIKKEAERENERDIRTNDLYSFTAKGWEKVLPSMSEKKSQVAAVCNGKVLTVAGGRGDLGRLATVEVLNLDTKLWSFAASLPQAVFRASSCICGDYFYVLGGERDKDKPSKYVFKASLSDLLQSSDPSSIGSSDEEPVFREVEKLPVKNPACLAIHGQVLAIGGLKYDQFQQIPSEFAYKYDPSIDCWQQLDNPMSTPRNRCFAVALSETRLMVVGGYTIQPDVGCTNTVEFANITAD